MQRVRSTIIQNETTSVVDRTTVDTARKFLNFSCFYNNKSLAEDCFRRSQDTKGHNQGDREAKVPQLIPSGRVSR